MGKAPKWGANTYKKRHKRKRKGRHKKRKIIVRLDLWW